MNTAHAKTGTFSWWPRVIIGFFILFAIFIGNFVRLAMKSDVDLVSKDYYQKEIAYQEHINTVAQTRENKADIHVTLAEAAGQLVIAFPDFFKDQKVTGKVNFFRPSDAKLDFEKALELNDDRQQFIPVDKLQRGLWKLQISSQANGKNYFTEQTITLK